MVQRPELTDGAAGAPRNADSAVIEGFGDEWSRFDQSHLSEDDRQAQFDLYFAVFRWDELPAGAVGVDVGCGSGRWATLAARRVALLHCVDPSPAALNVARRNLEGQSNVRFHEAGVGGLPFDDASMDFAYSLGVLHHVPDTAAGMRECVRILKPGAQFLVYLYYAFDNRPAWFRGLWRMSDVLRGGISRLPHGARYLTSQVIAATVYWPLARTADVLERAGVDVAAFPLSAYRHRQFYTMRTDALDRFGTRLERRFTRPEIAAMMQDAGLEDIRFHDGLPHWCAVGRKA